MAEAEATDLPVEEGEEVASPIQGEAEDLERPQTDEAAQPADADENANNADGEAGLTPLPDEAADERAASAGADAAAVEAAEALEDGGGEVEAAPGEGEGHSTKGDGDEENAPGSAAGHADTGEVADENEEDASHARASADGGAADEEETAHPEQPTFEGLPQSDTFADGEAAESKMPRLSEQLTEDAERREQDEQLIRPITPPDGDMPASRALSQAGEQDQAETLEEADDSSSIDRELLIERYQQLVSERDKLQQRNHQNQHKLANHFRKKKAEESRQEGEKSVADQEQRYLKYMSSLEELRFMAEQMRHSYKQQIEELQEKCKEREERVNSERGRFIEFKRQVALDALNSRSGKPILPKDIEQYLGTEYKKDQEVISVRLDNIKLKNKLKKNEAQLKSKEELAEGLHLIDFEQLKIENQTYNEKIEERNEELLKLRKKITNTVQVLTHLKEKLQFVQGENQLLKGGLKETEASVAQKRDTLTRIKQARDALRIDNHRLRQNCGLLGNEPLLRDFEDRKDETEMLKQKLEQLKMQHAELTLSASSLRRKIDQVRSASD